MHKSHKTIPALRKKKKRSENRTDGTGNPYENEFNSDTPYVDREEPSMANSARNQAGDTGPDGVDYIYTGRSEQEMAESMVACTRCGKKL